MTSPLADFSAAADVQDAIERGPLEYWRAWCSYCPGAVFEEHERFTRFLTGAPFAPCNQVVLTDLASEGIEPELAEIHSPYRERSLPMLWSVSPSVRPQTLGDILQARGFAAEAPLTGMALELSGLPDASTVPGLSIERVTDEKMLHVWGKTYHDGFGLPPGFADTFVATFKRAGFGAPTPFHHYVALLDDQPVACSTMFLGAGAAGLWHITTLPRARGRGIGGEMTLAPLRDARELGYRLGTLYAALMGKPVYLRLGFVEQFEMMQYTWLPGDNTERSA